MSTLIAPLFRIAAHFNPRLTILIYHSVLPEPDPLRPDTPDARFFAAQLHWLASVYRFLPLDEAVLRLQNGTLPRRAAVITFDDGYQDNLDVAAPLLNALGLPATFFLTSAWLKGGMMFNDSIIETVRRWPDRELDGRELGLERYPLRSDAERVRAYQTIITRWKHLPFAERSERVAAFAARVHGLPERLMLNEDGVRALRRAGMSIGGHTHSHPILAKLDRDSARQQIASNKTLLETILGEPITQFAYPNGRPQLDYLAEHTELARECGYHAAVTTAAGAAQSGDDPFQLPRFTPWDKDALRFLSRLALNTRSKHYARV